MILLKSLLLTQWNHSFRNTCIINAVDLWNHLLYGFFKTIKAEYFGGIIPFTIYLEINCLVGSSPFHYYFIHCSDNIFIPDKLWRKQKFSAFPQLLRYNIFNPKTPESMEVTRLSDLLLLELAGICLYRNLLEDRSVKSVVTLLRLLQTDNAQMENIISAYSTIAAELLSLGTPSFHDHMKALARCDENAFTLACERHEADLNGPLARQARSDLQIIGKLAGLRCADLKKKMKEKAGGNIEVNRLIDALPDWNSDYTSTSQWGEEIAEIACWHEEHGAGQFCGHAFFIWDPEQDVLKPVTNPDPITLDRLYLLDHQKAMAIKNTKLFLEGKEANNILFYGDRGTGKSSLVKALANAFDKDGLRLVEIQKKHMEQIPRVTSLLSGRGLKFILFIDDLAFDNNEEKYTALKAVLEGGLEYKPRNILLYATSNRRHLVKETFADRNGLFSDNPDEEIRAKDGMQEKLSLADRFGITLVFSSPIKKEYLEIVRHMAEEEKLQIDEELLAKKAMQWEMAYNGMSPRTARQFINWLKAGGETL